MTGYALDYAVACAAETPPTKRARWGTRSEFGWWIVGTYAWLPRPADSERLLDLLAAWGQHANIEDAGISVEQRFLVMCGRGLDMMVAYGPTLTIALARAVVKAADKTQESLTGECHGTEGKS